MSEQSRTGRDESSVANQDSEIRRTEDAAKESASAARLFDIRRLIGGLFIVYGVIVLVQGLVDGAKAQGKAAGIDINLWSGIAMLAFGVLMVLWQVVRPLQIDPADLQDEGDDRPRGGH